MSKCDRPSDPYFQNERRDLLPLIPHHGTKLLDVGCAEGGFAHLLKQERGYTEAWGMELDERAASVASTRLEKVVIGDVTQTLDSLPNHHFDLVCMNDVLEHLIWPEEFLKRLHGKLTPDAYIFCSVPNIRQFRILWNLLQHQDFEYTESGILDRTHLRFFTKKTFLSMLDRAGYEPLNVVSCCGTTRSWKFRILNALTLWRGSDMQHSHIYVLARAKQ